MIRLQRAAGNRAVARMLQRKVITDVLGGDVGDDFATALTPAELSEQIRLLVDALDSPKAGPADRETWGQNLSLLEAYAAAQGIDLPYDTGFHAREVVTAVATGLGAMLTTVKEMTPGSDYSDEWRMFSRELKWEVEQLEWISNTLGETARMTQEAQAGGPKSAEQFREIGTRLNALIFASKIMEIHISHMRVALTVFGHLTYDHLTQEMGLLHRELDAPLAQMKLLDNRMVNDASKAVLDYNWRWEFLNWIDELEEAMRSWRLFTGFINIAMLALTAYDIWALPGVGGGGKPPPISGGGIGGAGGAVAVATTDVLASAESLEALRRLVAVGAIESPGLVKVLGGRGIAIERPPAPVLAAGKGSPGGGAGKAAAPAASTKRLAKGLPSPEEDTIIQRYTQGLAKLRASLRKLKSTTNAGDAAAARARAEVKEAEAGLQAIEHDASTRYEKTKGEAEPSELQEHLKPLIREREVLKGSEGLQTTTTGRRVKALAVENSPKNLRDMDFADIAEAMKDAKGLAGPPKVTAVKKGGGATLATAHQRIEWEFTDGSELVIDEPAVRADAKEAAKLPESAKRPHAELHGPKGERLDQQGIEVPERSISAHMTITDFTKALETFFSKARKGR